MSEGIYIPLQAEHASSPWRVLVICALLNLTSRDQVRPILPEFFDRWPNPPAVAAAGPDLEEFLTPLGLAEQRARRLRRMAAEFDLLDNLSSTQIEGIFACGSYSAHAFRIFCQGDVTFPPADRVLRAYVEALCSST